MLYKYKKILFNYYTQAIYFKIFLKLLIKNLFLLILFILINFFVIIKLLI